MRVFINSKKFGEDYEWYSLTAEGAQPVERDPASYVVLKQRDLTRAYAAILYRTRGGCYGIYWGPAASNASDGMTRTTQFTLLIEFDEAVLATEFYGGLLRHWWTQEEILNTLLGQLISAVMQETAEAAPQLRAYLQECAMAWRQEEVERLAAAHIPCSAQPHLAALQPERLQQLVEWLRFDFAAAASRQTRRQSESVMPLVVITKGLVPERLRGIWRALTDRTSHEGWLPNGDQPNLPDASFTQWLWERLVACQNWAEFEQVIYHLGKAFGHCTNFLSGQPTEAGLPLKKEAGR
ncbi:MAG: hypothetical protein HY011_31420 [Acidobacteria bacterium]|nr:hypothetical protein [Acidobacteriota bacterium]